MNLTYISTEIFFNKYGIPIPKNATERDVLIMTELATIQSLSVAHILTPTDVAVRMANLLDYMKDTQHVSNTIVHFSKN